MKTLNIKAFVGLFFLLLVMAAELFLSAWTFHYWQAWTFLGVFGVSVSATIEIGDGQKVVSTGPYVWVRHPMYSGAIVMLLGIPLALGSWWGLLAVIPIMSVIIWRLVDEETLLAKNLAGYREYQAKVRWHLIPGIF